jgi:putative ABC transport system permease protein
MEEFLAAGTMVFVIALVTVSYQTLKAAAANPVDALKYE